MKNYKYKYEISKKEFEILKQYGLALASCSDLEYFDNKYYIFFNDYDEFSTNLTFDIVEGGMDNQDTVNDIGREMYAIHDRIYY